LGRFQSEEEARELLSIPHDRTFTEEEIQIGLNAGERHPYRLQWAGWFLYESKGEGGGKYHDEQGNLIDGAEEKLKEEVDEKYKEMMRRSGVDENSGAVRKRITEIWKKLTD
jgi:hypothetical protein